MAGPVRGALALLIYVYAVISDSRATRFGITRVDPLCVMRCCFLKPAKRRLTVSRDDPIICPISSWVKASIVPAVALDVGVGLAHCLVVKEGEYLIFPDGAA